MRDLMHCPTCGYNQAIMIKENTNECPMCHRTFAQENQAKIISKELKDKAVDYEKLMQSVITLKTESGLGVGFLFDQRGYVLTNAHVMGDTEFCFGQFGHISNLFECVLIAKSSDSDIDLAVLKIENDSYFSKLQFDEELPKIGDDVFAIGNPKGLGTSIVKGTIAQVKDKHILLNMSINPGNSGGPVINKKGKIVGVVSFRYKEVEGMAFAISLKTIKLFINSVIIKEESNV